MGVFKNNELSYEKRLEIVFYKNNGKSYREISTIVGCSKSAAFAVCKKFFQTRTVKNLPRVGRPKKITMPREERSLLRELRNNRFELLPEIILSCKKKLNFGTLAKNTARKIIKKYKFSSCIRKKSSMITKVNRHRE